MVAAAIGASAVGSLATGVMGASAAGDAAKAQQQATERTQALLGHYYDLASSNLSPFMATGVGANNALAGLTGAGPGGNPLTAALTKPFNPTMEQLEQTPGYQFTRNQGLKSVQNSMAAKGLGGSGEALAGAASYATGLAGTTYQQQFQNYLGQNQQIFNMLNSLNTGGQGAAQGLSALGLQAGGGQGQAIVGGGNAEAAGILGENSAWSNALKGLSGLPTQYFGLNALQGMTGNSTATNGAPGVANSAAGVFQGNPFFPGLQGMQY